MSVPACLGTVVLVLAGCRGSQPARVQPIDVEVRAPGPDGLDQAALDAVVGHRDVARVIPRLAYGGQAVATATVGGHDILVEAGPFTDGVPAAAVADDPALAARFVDLDRAAPPGPACDREPGGACPAGGYCDGRDQRCHPRVPVLVSPATVAMYRDTVAAGQGLPADVADQLAAGRPLPFTLRLGRSNLTDADPARPVRDVGADVIGVSARALPLGMTVPIGYVAAWNREQLGAGDAVASSLIVTLRDRGRLDDFARWARDQLGVAVWPVDPRADAGPLTGASADR